MTPKHSPELPPDSTALDRIFEIYRTIVIQETSENEVQDLIERYSSLGFRIGALFVELGAELAAQKTMPSKLSFIEQPLLSSFVTEEKLKQIYLETTKLIDTCTINPLSHSTNSSCRAHLFMHCLNVVRHLSNEEYNGDLANNSLNDLHQIAIKSIECSNRLKTALSSSCIQKQKHIIGRKSLSRIFLCQETINFPTKSLEAHFKASGMLKNGEDPHKFINKFRNRHSIKDHVYFQIMDTDVGDAATNQLVAAIPSQLRQEVELALYRLNLIRQPHYVSVQGDNFPRTLLAVLNNALSREDDEGIEEIEEITTALSEIEDSYKNELRLVPPEISAEEKAAFVLSAIHKKQALEQTHKIRLFGQVLRQSQRAALRYALGCMNLNP